MATRIKPFASYKHSWAVQFCEFWNHVRTCRNNSLFQIALATNEKERLDGIAMLGFFHSFVGSGWAGLRLLRHAIFSMHRRKDMESLTQAYSYLGIAYFMDNQPERGRFYHAFFFRHFAKGNPFFRNIALSNMLAGTFRMGDFFQLRDFVNRCFRESFGVPSSRQHVQVYGWQAFILAAEGRGPEALDALERSHKTARQNDNYIDWTIYWRIAAFTQLLLGREAEAKTACENGVTYCKKVGNPKVYSQWFRIISLALSGKYSKEGDRFRAWLFSSAQVYLVKAKSDNSAIQEAGFRQLGKRLSNALSSSFAFSADVALTSERLTAALESTFATKTVIVAEGAAELRTLAMKQLGEAYLSGSNIDNDDVRLVGKEGGLFIGCTVPATEEIDGQLAVGVLLEDIDLVSESIYQAALRMLLTYFVTAKSARIVRQKYEAEQRVAALGRLTRMFAHDVRQPFAIVKILIQTLGKISDPKAFTSAAAEFTEEINASIASVEALISDVLEVERGDDSVSFSSGAIDDVVREALHQVARANPNANVEISSDFRHSSEVLVDEQRMNRVFCNLFGNSVEAMAGLKTLGHIKVRTKDLSLSDVAFVEVSIKDSGPGIRAEDAATVFDPLFTRGKSEGTGLGLAIAKKIVDEHGGRILCRVPNSEEQEDVGQGAEFVLRIPASGLQTSKAEELPRSFGELCSSGKTDDVLPIFPTKAKSKQRTAVPRSASSSLRI